jgi:hypothetical protein
MLPTEGRAAKFIGQVGAELDVEAGRNAACRRTGDLRSSRHSLLTAVVQQSIYSRHPLRGALSLLVREFPGGAMPDPPRVLPGRARQTFGMGRKRHRLPLGMQGAHHRPTVRALHFGHWGSRSFGTKNVDLL